MPIKSYVLNIPKISLSDATKLSNILFKNSGTNLQILIKIRRHKNITPPMKELIQGKVKIE